MRIYLFIAAIAGGVTYLITPLIRHIAIEIGAVGEVRARDVHTIPTPRLGGLGMLIGFTVSMLFASRIPFIQGLFAQSQQAWVILAGAIMISLLGMADDLWDLDWMLEACRSAVDFRVRGMGRSADHFASAWLVGDGVAEPVDGHHRVFDRRVHQCGQFRGWVGRSVVGHCGDRRHRIRHLFIHHRPQLAFVRFDGDIDRHCHGRHVRGLFDAQLASGEAVHGRLRFHAARLFDHVRVDCDDGPP